MSKYKIYYETKCSPKEEIDSAETEEEACYLVNEYRLAYKGNVWYE